MKKKSSTSEDQKNNPAHKRGDVPPCSNSDLTSPTTIITPPSDSDGANPNPVQIWHQCEMLRHTPLTKKKLEKRLKKKGVIK